MTAAVNLVFDFGKVVFDWEPRALLARLLPHRAGDEDAALALETRFFEGFGGDWGNFDRGLLDATTLADRIVRRTGLAPHEARAVIDAVPHELRVLPSMRVLLQRLHDRGVPLYFLSNMPRPYADALDAAHAFLRPSPAGVFRGGIYSGRVGLVKPEPAIYALLLERFGLVAAETLFVDDLAVNVDAARDAGWRGLRFENVVQCEAELRRFGLD